MAPSRCSAFRKPLFAAGLVAGLLLMLPLTVPSIKQSAKEQWHRWKCPDVPKDRSERTITPDGRPMYNDHFPFCGSATVNPATLFYDFECPSSTFFTATKDAASGEGVLEGHWLSTAIQRRAGDIGGPLIAIAAGCVVQCGLPSPDIRIVIRIDRADGTLIGWNEKRLLPEEHVPDKWERFNFEWLLRDVAIGPDDLISVFIIADDLGVRVDDLSIVFKSRGPLPMSVPHA